MIRILASIFLLGVSALTQAEQVLVANPGIGITSLPRAQVSRLFFGITDTLPSGARAVPLDVAGPAKDEFSRTVLKKSPEEVERYWARMTFTGKAKPPREVRPGDVKAVVTATPGAISYLNSDQVDSSVLVIEISP